MQNYKIVSHFTSRGIKLPTMNILFNNQTLVAKMQLRNHKEREVEHWLYENIIHQWQNFLTSNQGLKSQKKNLYKNKRIIDLMFSK